MKRTILFTICFVAVFIVSAIAHTPISFALKYLPEVRGLKIEYPRGTLWQGEAHNVIWQGEKLGQVNWQLQSTKLLKGKVDYYVRFGRGSNSHLLGKGYIGYDFSGPYIENLIASVPAERIIPYLSLPVPISVSGTVELSVNNYRYAEPWCKSAKGALVWSGSKVATPIGVLDLGTVISDLSCLDSQLNANSEHENKQVAGLLEAELQKNMRYSINAWFRPNADFPPSMRSQLKWLGKPNSKGEFPFTYAGKLN